MYFVTVGTGRIFLKSIGTTVCGNTNLQNVTNFSFGARLVYILQVIWSVCFFERTLLWSAYFVECRLQAGLVEKTLY